MPLGWDGTWDQTPVVRDESVGKDLITRNRYLPALVLSSKNNITTTTTTTTPSNSIKKIDFRLDINELTTVCVFMYPDSFYRWNCTQLNLVGAVSIVQVSLAFVAISLLTLLY